MFCKKGILRNFAKFTGKHLRQRLFLKSYRPQACNFIKKVSLAQVFSCEFCEISKNTYFYRTPLVAASANISETYERCFYKQIQTYFDEIFSIFQCGFCKRFKAHHCLVSMVEIWKESVYNGGAFGTLNTDLFKAFDCLYHYILT